MSQPVPPPSGNPFAGGRRRPVRPDSAARRPVRDNVGLGIVAAVVAALVAAGAYGAIGGAIEREIGYAAIGVGFLVGFAAAKVGGRNPALPVVSARARARRRVPGPADRHRGHRRQADATLAFTESSSTTSVVLTDAWRKRRTA